MAETARVQMETPGTSEMSASSVAAGASGEKLENSGNAPVQSVSNELKPPVPGTLKAPAAPVRQAKSYRRPPPQDSLVPLRRSSTRSIKRKKFDDEVVESSLVKSDRGRIKAMPVPPPPPHPQPPLPISGLVGTPHPEPPIATPLEPLPGLAPPPEKKAKVPEKKASKSTSKRARRQKPPPPASTKDLGRWKPQDDLALITAVEQTNDLDKVYYGVKFSCRFTRNEVQERWYALLYDPIISRLAVQAMKQLTPDMVQAVQSKALYSKLEESLLGTITANTQPPPTVEVFQELLNNHPNDFHRFRTAKALFTHWQLMKQYHLLPDQSVQPLPRGDHVLNFSDAEDLLNDNDLKDTRDEATEHELAVADRKNKREIRHLENEIPKWQVLVDNVVGISPPDFDNQTLAVLRGRLVRYLMRSREISLGRATADNNIDVDLALEGPAWKISRRQGIIKLRNNGDFFIANEGKRPFYIDGKPVLAGNKHKLVNNSVVEISCLRFIFLINQDLINAIKTPHDTSS